MLTRALITTLLLAGLYLQYKYWFSDVGYFRDQVLAEEVEKQRQRLSTLEERNRYLTQEVRAQKQGLAAVEAKGESEPLVATADGVREPQNRRVEIILE